MRKIISKISCLIMFIGFYVLVGTAGASDLDLIGMSDIISRGLIGIVLMLTGFIGVKIGGGRYVY